MYIRGAHYLHHGFCWKKFRYFPPDFSKCANCNFTFLLQNITFSILMCCSVGTSFHRCGHPMMCLLAFTFFKYKLHCNWNANILSLWRYLHLETKWVWLWTSFPLLVPKSMFARSFTACGKFWTMLNHQSKILTKDYESIVNYFMGIFHWHNCYTA